MVKALTKKGILDSSIRCLGNSGRRKYREEKGVEGGEKERQVEGGGGEGRSSKGGRKKKRGAEMIAEPHIPTRNTTVEQTHLLVSFPRHMAPSFRRFRARLPCHPLLTPVAPHVFRNPFSHGVSQRCVSVCVFRSGPACRSNESRPWGCGVGPKPSLASSIGAGPPRPLLASSVLQRRE